MAESIHDKKKRVRPPRVNITYEVELGGAMVMKELPFVVGVVGDMSGNPEKSLGKLKDRKFVEVDRDNFDTVLKSMTPRTVLVELERNANKNLLLSKANVDLNHGEVDVARIQDATFQPETLTLFGPDEQIQRISNDTKLFTATITAQNVVICAGMWSRQLGAGAGIIGVADPVAIGVVEGVQRTGVTAIGGAVSIAVYGVVEARACVDPVARAVYVTVVSGVLGARVACVARSIAVTSTI